MTPIEKRKQELREFINSEVFGDWDKQALKIAEQLLTAIEFSERIKSLDRLSVGQLKQLTRRINLLTKRIDENPGKEMGFDKAERSAILRLIEFHDGVIAAITEEGK